MNLVPLVLSIFVVLLVLAIIKAANDDKNGLA